MASMSCQQGILYAAETMVPWGPQLSQEAAQAFVDEARDRYVRWLDDFSNVARVEVVVDPTRRGSVGKFEAGKGAGLCVMAPQHATPLILCHEAAHVLAAARFGSTSHDPWFARIYLELVYACMGSDAYQALRDAFIELGIDHEVDLD